MSCGFMFRIVGGVHCGAGAAIARRFARVGRKRSGFLLIIRGFVKISGLQVELTPMKKIAPLPETTEEEPPFKPLTAQEAQKLREQNPPVSPWWIVAGQAVVGLVVALAAWAITGRQNVGWSAAYGALAVVIPAALMARCPRSGRK